MHETYFQDFFPKLFSISNTGVFDLWPWVLYIASRTICFILFVVLYVCLSAYIFGFCVQNYSWYMFGHRVTEDVASLIPVTFFLMNFYNFFCSASGASSNSDREQEKLICVQVRYIVWILNT